MLQEPNAEAQEHIPRNRNQLWGREGEREKRQMILENKIGREFGGVDGKRVGGPRGRRETEEETLVVNRRKSRE